MPNNDTYCAVLRGLFRTEAEGEEPNLDDSFVRGIGAGKSVDIYSKITSAMMSAGVVVGPKIMAYGLELCLRDGALESVCTHTCPCQIVVVVRIHALILQSYYLTADNKCMKQHMLVKMSTIL